jgi:hypothetical protein
MSFESRMPPPHRFLKFSLKLHLTLLSAPPSPTPQANEANAQGEMAATPPPFSLPKAGSQRDFVVYLGWPIAPSHMSPNAEGGGLQGLTPMSTAVYIEPQKNLEI